MDVELLLVTFCIEAIFALFELAPQFLLSLSKSCEFSFVLSSVGRIQHFPAFLELCLLLVSRHL